VRNRERGGRGRGRVRGRVRAKVMMVVKVSEEMAMVDVENGMKRKKVVQKMKKSCFFDGYGLMKTYSVAEIVVVVVVVVVVAASAAVAVTVAGVSAVV